MLRAFLKDSVIYAIPMMASRGLALLLVPLYTRVLSPDDYGSMDLFTAFASIVSLTIALEVAQGVARFYQQEPDAERRLLYASSAFWFSLAVNSVFAAVMFGLSPWISTLIMGRSGLDGAFNAGLAQIWITSVLYMLQGQLRWQLRSIQFATVSLAMVFVSAAVSVWLTIIMGMGLEGLFLGTVAGTAVASALALWWLRDSLGFRIDYSILGEMLRFSTPLVLSSVAVWVTLYVDRLVINHYLSVADVGLYGIGFRVASIVSLVVVAFQGALTPLIYARFQEEGTPAAIATIFRVFIGLGLFAWLGLTLFSTTILEVMTTPDYYDGASVIPILAPSILFTNMYIFFPGISIAKKTHIFVFIYVIGGGLNLALSILLTPQMGITGTALATLVSCGAMFAAVAAIGQRFYAVPAPWPSLAGITALATLIIIIAPMLPKDGAQYWLCGLAALVAYASGVLAFGLLRRQELTSGWRSARSVISKLQGTPTNS